MLRKRKSQRKKRAWRNRMKEQKRLSVMSDLCGGIAQKVKRMVLFEGDMGEVGKPASSVLEV